MRCFFEHYRVFLPPLPSPHTPLLVGTFLADSVLPKDRLKRKDDFPYAVFTLTWGLMKMIAWVYVWADEAATKCLHSFSCNLIPGFSHPSSSWIRNGKYESSVSQQRFGGWWCMCVGKKKKKKKKRHLRAACKWYLLYSGLLTPDRNNTHTLCVPTHNIPAPLLQSAAQPQSGLVVWSLNMNQDWSLLSEVIPFTLYVSAPTVLGAKNDDIWKQTATASCWGNGTLTPPIAAFCITAVCWKNKTGCGAEGFIKTLSLIVTLIFQVLWQISLKHHFSYTSCYMLSDTQLANFKSQNGV